MNIHTKNTEKNKQKSKHIRNNHHSIWWWQKKWWFVWQSFILLVIATARVRKQALGDQSSSTKSGFKSPLFVKHKKKIPLSVNGWKQKHNSPLDKLLDWRAQTNSNAFSPPTVSLYMQTTTITICHIYIWMIMEPPSFSLSPFTVLFTTSGEIMEVKFHTNPHFDVSNGKMWTPEKVDNIYINT